MSQVAKMTDQNNKGESMKKQEANKILLRYKRADDKKAIKLASEDVELDPCR